jgi:hypothetical protein
MASEGSDKGSANIPQVASSGSTQSTRIRKELESFPYPVNVIDSNTWVVTTEDGMVEVRLPKGYPFKPPTFVIQAHEPINFEPSNWRPSKLVKNYIANLKKNKKVQEAMQITDINMPAIEAKKSSTLSPSYLVLGANPGEARGKRVYYNDPHYWQMDIVLESYQASPDTSRFFKIDFNNIAQLSYLASKLPKSFDIICFDYATITYFWADKNPEYLRGMTERLINIRALLKDDGYIYMERISQPTGSWPASYQGGDSFHLFKQSLTNAGLIIEAVGTEKDFADDPVVNEVYIKNDMYTCKGILLKLKKNPVFGGKRKYHRKRKTRKALRKKSKTIRKHF